MIEELKAAVATLQSALEREGAQLRKVSDRLEVVELMPRLVGNR